MTSDRKIERRGLGVRAQAPVHGAQKRTRKRKLEGVKLLNVSRLCLETSNVCRLLDRIKREKGVWWMPWQQEAMKDVIICDKPWGADNML